MFTVLSRAIEKHFPREIRCPPAGVTPGQLHTDRLAAAVKTNLKRIKDCHGLPNGFTVAADPTIEPP